MSVLLKNDEPETESPVVDAYVKIEATGRVAVNEPAVALVPRSDMPLTERFLHGVVVPIPIQPPAVITLAREPF